MIDCGILQNFRIPAQNLHIDRKSKFVKKRVWRSKSLLSRSYFSKSTKQTTLTSFPMHSGELKNQARKCGHLIPWFLLTSQSQKQTIHQFVKLGIRSPQKIVDVPRKRGNCVCIKNPENRISDRLEMVKLWKSNFQIMKKWKCNHILMKLVLCPDRNVIWSKINFMDKLITHTNFLAPRSWSPSSSCFPMLWW